MNQKTDNFRDKREKHLKKTNICSRVRNVNAVECIWRKVKKNELEVGFGEYG